jgi:O-antigen/teichoic acid export membrane protein
MSIDTFQYATISESETTAERGRSRERYRRMALTCIASLFSRGISVIASLISIPLTLRYLGAERYGLWMVLLSYISLMGFADLGIGNGIVNAISEAHGKDDRALAAEYVSSGFFLMLGIAGILAIAGGVAYPFLPWSRIFNVHSSLVSTEGTRAFLILFSWFVINMPLGVVTRVQAALQQGYWSQMISASGNVVSLIGLLLAMKLHGNLAWLVCTSTFGVMFATVLNGWVLFWRHPWLIPSASSYRRIAARKIFSLGILFFVLQVSIAVGYSSDNIVIAQILGASAVALYAIPQKLFGYVSQLVLIGLTPLWPAYGEAMARGDVAWVRKTLFRSIALVTTVSIGMSTILVLCGAKIVSLWAGPNIRPSLLLLSALAASVVASSVSNSFSIFLNGLSIMRFQAICATVGSSANIVLSIYLTRRIGIPGVVIGSVVSQVVCGVIPACWYVTRHLRKRLACSELDFPNEQQI